MGKVVESSNNQQVGEEVWKLIPPERMLMMNELAFLTFIFSHAVDPPIGGLPVSVIETTGGGYRR